MGLARRLAGSAGIPRRTLRVRLTLVYGGLFLVSGFALLALTYALVHNATRGAVSYQGDNGISGSIDERPNRPGSAAPGDGPQLTPAQVDEQLQLLRDKALRQRADNLHELLVQAGIALAIMVAVSVALGWLIAGRLLRPLRTITSAAREISATDLHRRLDLNGPDDELKRLGDTFDELLSRLEASFQAQRRFVANASHELRTPLARQRVLAQVALDDPDATVESLRTAHQRVLAAGEQQERLIKALLTLARGQAGIESREPFDLATVAGQVLANKEPEVAARGLTPLTRLDPAPTVGNPQLAEQLVANLVDNALRYNRPDGTLEVTTGIIDGRPELRVGNTGPRIPDAAVEQLFQPFRRLESDRTTNSDGLGLGLSIVAAIAGAHGAELRALPGPDGGLSIRVGFPEEKRVPPLP
jgi:signal transduction histidine kinase